MTDNENNPEKNIDTLCENVESVLKDTIANISDKKIWECLKSVNADDFVRELGGLNAITSEAGKSLSGGQKRRLGIARAMLSQSDILIFDEITNGLDKKNKFQIKKLVNILCKSHIIVYITHEDTKFSKQKTLLL